MRKTVIAAAVVTTVELVLLGTACKQPAPAPPQAPVSNDDAAARARAEAEAKRRAEEEARRIREAKEKIEAARLADLEREKAFQRAAEAALKDLHFDYDKSDLRPEDKASLQGIATFMKSYPQARLKLEGHCDERGTVEYNIALGDRRANAAMSYLIDLGTVRERLGAVSYGKERPLCTEANEMCWSRNRRVHFAIKP